MAFGVTVIATKFDVRTTLYRVKSHQCSVLRRYAGLLKGMSSHAMKLPDLPPCFSTTRTSWMDMPLSTALHMS